jgi:hypothetical protein
VWSGLIRSLTQHITQREKSNTITSKANKPDKSFGDRNFGSGISTNGWWESITQASNLWKRILLKTWNCRDFKEFGVNGRDSGN